MENLISLETVLSKIILNRIAGREKYPLMLILETNSRCNLACKGCGKILEFHYDRDFMPVETAESAAIECDAPVVCVSGGEPLLHPRIDQIISALISLGKYVFLCTNGLLLTESLDSLKPDPKFAITLHLDGLKEADDMLTDQPGHFQEVMNAMRIAKKQGFIVYVNTTLYRDTKPEEIEKLFSIIKEHGIYGISVSPGYAFEANTKDIFLDRKEVEKKFHFLKNLSEKFSLLNTPDYLEFLAGKRSLSCSPWATPTYTNMGWKSPCYYLTDGFHKSFSELMERTDWSFYTSRRNPPCRNCMGHITHEATIIRQVATPNGFLKATRLLFRG